MNEGLLVIRSIRDEDMEIYYGLLIFLKFRRIWEIKWESLVWDFCFINN